MTQEKFLGLLTAAIEVHKKEHGNIKSIPKIAHLHQGLIAGGTIEKASVMNLLAHSGLCSKDKTTLQAAAKKLFSGKKPKKASKQRRVA